MMELKRYYRLRKIRKIAESKTGEVFGMTIPKVIAKDYGNTYFSILATGNKIIFQSGCKNAV